MIKVTKVTVDGSELIKTLQTLTSDEEFMTEVQSEFRDIILQKFENKFEKI